MKMTWESLTTKGRALWPVFILLAGPALANNLVITNVALVNVSNGTADIQFDMSWDHSWRATWTENGGTVTVSNWDAAWVFAKFRQSGQLWKHVMLTATGHTATGGTTLDVSNDGGTRLGAFVYPVDEGSGSVTCEQMRLHWDYVADGIAGTNEVDLTVMGVEMVYIPEGAFSLGSGGTEYNHFYRYPDTDQPFMVTNNEAIEVGAVTGRLYYTGGGDLSGPIPALFPKGYQAIYCMKYEMTQGQYADFLNLLDPTVANTYYPNAYGSSRHTIHLTNSQFEVDAPDRACNYLNADKILTYLDWSGLRPMTELEFEKICRGPRTPWVDEYVWGNTTYVALTGLSGVDGSGTETPLPTNANGHVGNPFSGPVRVGLFATDGSDREKAGAAYYGVMEMAGNVGEFVVAVARAEGRMFTDQYGDGSEYTARPSSWQPPPGGRAYTSRGGAFADLSALFQKRLSDRISADANNIFQNNGDATGCRGVRTAP